MKNGRYGGNRPSLNRNYSVSPHHHQGFNRLLNMYIGQNVSSMDNKEITMISSTFTEKVACEETIEAKMAKIDIVVKKFRAAIVETMYLDMHGSFVDNVTMTSKSVKEIN